MATRQRILAENWIDERDAIILVDYSAKRYCRHVAVMGNIDRDGKKRGDVLLEVGILVTDNKYVGLGRLHCCCCREGCQPKHLHAASHTNARGWRYSVSRISDPGVPRTRLPTNNFPANDISANHVDEILARRRCQTRWYLKLGRAGELLLAERARADLPLFLRRLYVQRFLFVLLQCIQAGQK